MTVSRVKHNNVNLSLDKSGHSVKNVCRCTDCGTADKSALVVTCRVGILNALFNILDCDKSLKTAVLADNRELFNSVLTKNLLRFLKSSSYGSSNEVFVSHNL